jgi:hypothetical protein
MEQVKAHLGISKSQDDSPAKVCCAEVIEILPQSMYSFSKLPSIEALPSYFRIITCVDKLDTYTAFPRKDGVIATVHASHTPHPLIIVSNHSCHRISPLSTSLAFKN